jgi:hypothetical protein
MCTLYYAYATGNWGIIDRESVFQVSRSVVCLLQVHGWAVTVGKWKVKISISGIRKSCLLARSTWMSCSCWEAEGERVISDHMNKS